MAKGLKYEILKEIEKQNNIVLTNRQFDKIASEHIRNTYTFKKILMLIKIYGVFKVRPEKMILKPLKDKKNPLKG